MNTTWNRGRTALSMLSLGIVAMLPSPARADNPIVQTIYTADPAPMVHEDTLYLYVSHDEDVTVNNFYTMNDWRLYTTNDMVNWTDRGSPAGLSTFSWGTDSAWAPQAIARNGQYYLYVPLNNNTGARIGVGVSDNPAGPFTDPLGRQLAASGSGNIDPTAFIDDDGQAYMYWGNGTLRYVLLSEDMISYSGDVVEVGLDGFTEGPWLYKRESLYYLVYAGMGGATEKLSYATSDSPKGPWKSRGDIMDATSTYTNHPGVVDYKGHSYFFYHNSALPGGNDFKRSVCVEEFTYGTDGSIPRLKMSEEGPSAVATLNPFARVEAETIAFSSGIKTEECTDDGAGMNVTSISDGDYIKVKDVEFLDGVTSFEARVSSSASSAVIEIHIDDRSGTSLGTCDVSGSSSWTTITCPVSGGSGTHDLFLTFTGSGDDLFKFNWWKFTGPTMPHDGDGGEGGMGGEGGAVGGGGGDVAGQGGTAGGAGVTGGGTASDVGGRGGSVSDAGGSENKGGSGPAAGGSSENAGGSLVAAGGSPVGAGGSASGTGGAIAATGGGPVHVGGSISDTGGLGGSVSGTGGVAGRPVVTGGSPGSMGGSVAATGGLVGGSGGASPGTSAPNGGATAAQVGDAGVSRPDDGACSCRVGARHPSHRALAGLCLVASAWFLRRRRR